jgi:DnaJ-class molecular chaperone
MRAFAHRLNLTTTTYAQCLKRGLAALLANFTAVICDVCHGRGEYQQTYVAGCGDDCFKALGVCEYCSGTGLLQGRKPASGSVAFQVINVADSASLRGAA